MVVEVPGDAPGEATRSRRGRRSARSVFRSRPSGSGLPATRPPSRCPVGLEISQLLSHSVRPVDLPPVVGAVWSRLGM